MCRFELINKKQGISFDEMCCMIIWYTLALLHLLSAVLLFHSFPLISEKKMDSGRKLRWLLFVFRAGNSNLAKSQM